MEENVKKSVRVALARANAMLMEKYGNDPSNKAYMVQRNRFAKWWEAYHRGDTEEMERLEKFLKPYQYQKKMKEAEE